MGSRKWLHALLDQLKHTWVPGVSLCLMRRWCSGPGLVLSTLPTLPRKPSPLGVMFKVTCLRGDAGVPPAC